MIKEDAEFYTMMEVLKKEEKNGFYNIIKNIDNLEKELFKIDNMLLYNNELINECLEFNILLYKLRKKMLSKENNKESIH